MLAVGGEALRLQQEGYQDDGDSSGRHFALAPSPWCHMAGAVMGGALVQGH